MEVNTHYCDPSQVDKYSEERLAALIPVILSTLGGIMLIFLYLRHQYLRNFGFLLVIHITISDLIYCVAHFMQIKDLEERFNIERGDNISTECYIQAAMIQFGGLSSVMWTGMVAWTLYSTVVLNQREAGKNYKRYLLVSYGFPLLTAIIPYFTGNYGYAGHWCWITVQDEHQVFGNILRFGLFYGPIWILFIFNVVWYIKVHKFAREVIQVGPELSFVSRLKYYPLVLLLCWALPTIDRVYAAVQQCESNLLNIVSFASSGMQGFLNACVYGFSYSARDACLLTFSVCVPCIEVQKKKKDGEVELENRTSRSNSVIEVYYDDDLDDF